MNEIMGPQRWRQPEQRSQALEDGRLLIQHGRAWLKLTHQEDSDERR